MMKPRFLLQSRFDLRSMLITNTRYDISCHMSNDAVIVGVESTLFLGMLLSPRLYKGHCRFVIIVKTTSSVRDLQLLRTRLLSSCERPLFPVITKMT